MRPERLRLFAQLAEQLMEASTAGDLVKRHPGGNEIMQKLHRDLGLPHNVTWSELGMGERFHWTPFKETKFGSWVIVKGPKGTGAIQAQKGGGAYLGMASTGGPIETIRDDRGGNIVDFLVRHLGKDLRRYSGDTVGPASTYQRTDNPRQMTYPEKTKYRKDLKTLGGSKKTMDADAILKRFKPLWKSGVVKAMADIQGFVSQQIKAGAYAKAESKIQRLKKLQSIMNILDNDEELPPSNDYSDSNILSSAVKSAITLGAAHYYPELTGNVTKNGYSYRAGNAEGTQKLLQDIAGGDTSKMFTVAHFFRRSLIS
jgi:hypothetical protein